MRREDILKSIKREMLGAVEDLNFQNLDFNLSSITSYVNFLKSLQHIPEFIRQGEEEKVGLLMPDFTDRIFTDFQESADEGFVAEEAQGEEPPIVAEESRKMYKFARKLRGGYVPELSALVPESIVRELGVNDGDYLYWNGGHEYHGKKFYEWEIAKQGDGTGIPEHSTADRHEHRYCIVIVRDGIMMVEKSAAGWIRIDEIMQSLLITQSDRDYFALEEGDIIDIAFSGNDTANAKVIWKYPVEEIPESVHKDIPAKKKKNSKEKKIQEAIQKESLDPQGLLRGKTDMVYGAEWRRIQLEGAFEPYGVIYNWVDNDSPVHTAESQARKSDMVIMLKDHMSHECFWHMKAFCKEEKIPFWVVARFGTSTIIRAAVKLAEDGNSGEDE